MSVHFEKRGFYILVTLSITALCFYLFSINITELRPKLKEIWGENKPLRQKQPHYGDQDLKLDKNSRMEIRMQERNALVQDFCRQRKNNDSLYGQDLRYFLVFHSRKVIYCFVPKVASRQWKKELLVLEEEDKLTFGEDKVKRNLNLFSPQDVKEMLENYFTFMFVRDPLERVLSAYKDKFLKENKVFHNAFGRSIIKQFRPNATEHSLKTGSDVTFPEFANYLAKTKHYDEHWRSFDELCHPCAVKYDFIGHYEDLTEDAPYLAKKAGIDDRVSFPPFRVSNTTADMLHYYSQIPKMRISQLVRRYESDYQMFGYAFPGQLETLFKINTNGNK